MLETKAISAPKATIGQECIRQIKDRQKTVEVRICQTFFRNIPPRNRIEFVGSDNPQHSIRCKIRYTKRYNNFRELL